MMGSFIFIIHVNKELSLHFSVLVVTTKLIGLGGSNVTKQSEHSLNYIIIYYFIFFVEKCL